MIDNKRIVKIASVELYEEDALKLYEEKKYIVTYGGVYQIHYSKNGGVYGHKVIEQKGIARRGRFYALTAKEINDVLGKKVLNED